MSIFAWNEKDRHGRETGGTCCTCLCCGAEKRWPARTPGHVVLREYQAFTADHRACRPPVAAQAGTNLNVEGARG
jgi:hypothetical protein